MRAMSSTSWLGGRLALAIVVALVAAGCGKDPPVFLDGGPIDAATDGGEVIEIDAGVTGGGHAGTGTVSGAVKASSANYSLYGTLKSGDGSSASPGYQRRGGVTGATQP